jgi:hypothetical protein
LQTVTNLNFENGNKITIIGDHGFWDYTLNKFVYIDDTNAQQFVGHYFNQDGTRVKLISAILEQRVTKVYSPVTLCFINFYANGLLTMPGETQPFANIFEVDPTTMKIDENEREKDLAKYGILDYAEVADFVPFEFFYAFNGQWQNVAMGKGLSSWELLLGLIDRSLEFLE